MVPSFCWSTKYSCRTFSVHSVAMCTCSRMYAAYNHCLNHIYHIPSTGIGNDVCYPGTLQKNKSDTNPQVYLTIANLEISWYGGEMSRSTSNQRSLERLRERVQSVYAPDMYGLIIDVALADNQGHTLYAFSWKPYCLKRVAGCILIIPTMHSCLGIFCSYYP